MIGETRLYKNQKVRIVAPSYPRHGDLRVKIERLSDKRHFTVAIKYLSEYNTIRKGTSETNFWIGDTLIDINMLDHHSQKKGARPWGHGHTIIQAIGNLAAHAQELFEGKPLQDGDQTLIEQYVKLLKNYSYPL